MSVTILQGDAIARLRELPDESAHCCVTSPPYWGLRDYGAEGQIGLEETPAEYVARLVDVFREVRRVLHKMGTAWVNLGDTYTGGRNGGVGGSSITSNRNHNAAKAAWDAQGGATHRIAPGLKPKELVGIPWRVAFALQDDGWWLRSDTVWHKPNPMPESVRDRPTRAHEYVFLLSKSRRYYYDADAIREPLRPKTLTTYGTTRKSKGNDALGGVKTDNWATDVPERKPKIGPDGKPVGANARSVWTIAQEPFAEAHFATMPRRLVERCILAGCPPGGTVLDPFGGAGTTGLVADRLGRDAVLIEINPEYCSMARRRIDSDTPLFPPVREGGGGG